MPKDLCTLLAVRSGLHSALHDVSCGPRSYRGRRLFFDIFYPPVDNSVAPTLSPNLIGAGLIDAL